MKTKLIGIIGAGILMFLRCSGAAAQTPVYPNYASNIDQIKGDGAAAAPGTYQFIVIPSESGDPFTRDILVMIESYRDDAEDRLLPLTQYTKVRIPSRTAIQNPGFKPLKEIVYTPNNKPLSQSK